MKGCCVSSLISMHEGTSDIEERTESDVAVERRGAAGSF